MVKADGYHKACHVEKGFTHVHRIDYEETFSLVLRYESIWYILSHTALLDWEIEAMDVKTAYLYGKLEEEIYMEQPEGFIEKGQENKVWKLITSFACDFSNTTNAIFSLPVFEASLLPQFSMYHSRKSYSILSV